VLVGLAVVIVVLVMIIKALASSGNGEPSPSPKPPPTKVASSAPPGGDPKVAPACSKEQLEGGALAVGGEDISLVKDKEAFAAGELVTMKASVKNMGAKDCSVLDNAHNVVLSVFSDQDRIFNSADCAAAVPEDSGDTITLKAGEVTDIPVSWEPIRTQQGCPDIAETVLRHREATYRATVTIAGVPSDETVFRLVP
jgi:hypothetical protein